MFCIKCGKQNPEGAIFCAFCGNRMPLAAPGQPSAPVIDSVLLEEEPAAKEAAHSDEQPKRAPDELKAAAPDEPAPQKASAPEKKPEPEASKAAAPDRDAPFRRPTDPARTVRPTRENPAQPLRGGETPPKSAESPEQANARSAAPDPARAVRPRREEPPARRAPIRPEPTRESRARAARTMVPRKKARDTNDLFFEDVELPEEQFDEMVEAGDLRHKIKSAVAAIFLLLVLGTIFYVMVLPGGGVLRASLGLNAPASAYKTLGDQYSAEGSIKRAASAYHDALKLEPDNYEYAYLTAQAMSEAGERENALDAYALCVKLDPTKPDPYLAIAALYAQTGQTQEALSALQTGYDKTGDVGLLKGIETISKQASASDGA